MTADRKRTLVTCGNLRCGKQFSIQDYELKRRLRESTNGHVFCCQECYQMFIRAVRKKKQN